MYLVPLVSSEVVTECSVVVVGWAGLGRTIKQFQYLVHSSAMGDGAAWGALNWALS